MKKEEQELQVIETPVAAGLAKSTPFQAMLEGKEEAYKTCLAMAIRSTKSQDWTDFGGKPFLDEAGARRIALRFGMSLKFDRNDKGQVAFTKEEFSDELGPLVVYTISGKATIGDYTVEAIGSASTRDKFLGWDKGKPKPLYAVIENVQKKACTNMFGNLIKAALGIKGFTWDDLAQYGITKQGKSAVKFKKASPQEEADPNPSTQSGDRPEGGPFYKFKMPDGKGCIGTTAGKHFSERFLKGLGMRLSSRKPGNWWTFENEAVEALLEAQYKRAEEDQGPTGEALDEAMPPA